MKWTGHVAWMGIVRNECDSLLRKPKRKGIPRDLNGNVRVILKSMCKKLDVKVSKDIA
jgi:hypothetical protein